jgi:hypothetical protein
MSVSVNPQETTAQTFLAHELLTSWPFPSGAACIYQLRPGISGPVV